MKHLYLNIEGRKSILSISESASKLAENATCTLKLWKLIQLTSIAEDLGQLKKGIWKKNGRRQKMGACC